MMRQLFMSPPERALSTTPELKTSRMMERLIAEQNHPAFTVPPSRTHSATQPPAAATPKLPGAAMGRPLSAATLSQLHAHTRLKPRLTIALGLALAALLGHLPADAHAAPPPGSVVARHDPVPHQSWSFDGPLGNFDTATLQRGYAVYAQICSRCHGMDHVKFADLAGIGLTPDQITAIAGTHMMLDGKDTRGRPLIRPARADDFFPAPPVTPGAPPVPDQSHLALVYPGGPDRVYALITGYRDAPAGKKIAKGMYYNPFALDYAIGMPPPLEDGSVQYADGTPATLKQEARDVTTFLYWVAQPHLADRHRYSVRVVLYLLFLAILLVILKRRVWSNGR